MLRSLDWLRQDVRYALRGLRKAPVFTLAVVLTLGLGLGANAAMFGVIDQLMFRPFPYLRDPARVNRVYLRVPGRDRFLTRESFPYARYLDLRNWTTSFSQSAAFFPVTVAVGSGEAARERRIAAVSASFFEFFDARPVIGRYFTSAEDSVPAGANVAVISFDYWRTELGGRADVLSQSILVNNVLCAIIGVAPQGFVGVADGSSPERSTGSSDGTPPAVFIPITTFGGHQPGGSSVDYWRRYTWDWAEMMVRRRPGVTVAQASADLTLAYVRSRDAARLIHDWMPRVDPVRPVAIAGALKTAAGPYPGLEARTLRWVTGVAVILLLVACANVANLYLTRALRRRREIALRLALGVSRSRLVRQSVTESLILALLGGGAGIAMAQWGGQVLRQLFLTGGTGVVADWRTLALAIAAAAAVGVLTGLIPVLSVQHDDLAGSFKSGAREGTYHRSRLRNALLVSQATFSVILLVGAGLFVRSLDHVRHLRLGYDTDRVLMVRWERRGEQMTVDERLALRHRLLARAQSIPGVERAAWVSNVPLQGTSTMRLTLPGIDSVARLGRFTYQSAGPDYFAVMDTRILRGRGFTDTDRLGTAQVAVVSDRMARTLWPGRDALGECMHVGAAGSDAAACTTVVGVAEDALHDPVRDEPMRYYLPMEQFPAEGGSLLLVRVRGTPGAMAEPVRKALQPEMPGQQYVVTESMGSLLEAQQRSWRVGATMFVAFGLLALVVAAVGLYGVIAFDVTQRMQELSVRVALGAQRLSVLRLVVGHSLRFAVAGAALGVVLSLFAGRFIQPLLFSESASDPLVFACVSAVILVVALVASASPALRAASADPTDALRSE